MARQKNKWLKEQKNKILSFLELVLTFSLDAGIIIIFWWLRQKVIDIVGLEPKNIDDWMFRNLTRILDVGTMIAVGCYIIADIIRQARKTYKSIF